MYVCKRFQNDYFKMVDNLQQVVFFFLIKLHLCVKLFYKINQKTILAVIVFNDMIFTLYTFTEFPCWISKKN